jgi:hypothetical protein
MTPAEHDLREFSAMLSATAAAVNTRVKRQIYSAIREGASMHTLMPRIGLTLGQIAMCLVLRDKA